MGGWTNLLILLLEAVLYFTVMAVLFRTRFRLGIGVLFCALGTMHFLETYLAAILYLQLPGDIVISPGSIVLFTGKLAVLLLVYIREDAATVRQPIYGLLVGNFLMVAMLFVARLHEIAPAIVGRPLDLRLMDEMGGLMIWGTILLFIDSILLILIYESTADWFGRRQLPRILLALAAVLTFDQIGFFTALHLLSGVPVTALYGGWIAKMIGAVLFGLMTALYLRRVEAVPATPHAARLVDVFDALTYRSRADGRDTAGHDASTGLYDRARFDGEGRSLVRDALRARRPVSVMLVAVDRFPEIHPRLGGQGGGDVLRQVAIAAQDGNRETERAYRFAADQIVVLCDGADQRAALYAAEHLRRRVAARLASTHPPVTASIGIATAPPDGEELDSLLRTAAERLAEAQRTGGDRVVGQSEPAPGNVAPFPGRR